MNKFILAEKLGMTQVFDPQDGVVVPVTVLKALETKVLQVKEVNSLGAKNLEVAFVKVLAKKLSKPRLGFFAKHGADPYKHVKEIRLSKGSALESASELSLDSFELNELVNVRSKSIGKGFAGTIKRWNFSRGPMSHGSKSHRIPGSIGGGTTPGRVLKGKKMAGQLGNEFVTVRNLKVVNIDAASGLLYVRGAVPGKKKNIVEIYN